MAFGNSGWYLLNWIDVFDATQLAIDLSLTSHKFALYTNTASPNFSADSAYSATNEVSGTGYTAGGTVIASPTTSDSSGSWVFDAADTSWGPGATFSSARGYILYADALAGNNTILGVTFGADYGVTNGTFTIQHPGGGISALDLTP